MISIISTCLAAFFALWLMVEVGDASLIDDPIRNAVISTRSDWLTPIMKAITYMGNWQTITVICLILLAFRKTRLTYGVPLSIGALFVSLANKGIKAIVMRPRPDQDMFLIEQDGWSFPSGHSITSMFFYGMAIWLIRRNVTDPRLADILTVLLAIPMVLIGVSRVYLGVHYPTDVLAGWCLGLLVIAAMSEIIKRTSNDIK
ncbi:MAG: phosphatase PAP2 family protein [Firmicutes bacterium]|nr:phosphatase PAP2 family protein [Bacillota bacterium]